MQRQTNYIKYLLLFSLFLCFNHSLIAQEWKLEKMNAKINTPDYDEIAPVNSLNGKTLCFTRVGYPVYDKTLMDTGEDLNKKLNSRKYKKRLAQIFSQIAERKIDDPIKSSFNQDIWIAYSNSGEFNIVQHPIYPLNNALPNSACAVSPDGNEMIVINQFDIDGGMREGFSTVQKYGNNWSFPKPMLIEGYKNIGTDVGLTMNNQGNVLILTMSGEDTHGENDLYVSFQTHMGSWSKPKNLGSVINSAKRETTPFLTVDNRTLYFSSNRPGGMGGNDIYYCTRLDNSWDNWSTPKLMEAPVNSTSDDAQPFFNTINGYLYFASKRDGTSDIFRVRIAKPVKETVTVSGMVYNPKTETPIPNVKIKRSITNANQYTEVAVSEDGTFEIELPKGVAYDIIAEKPGHIAERKTIEFKKEYLYFKDYKFDLVLRPIEAGTKINVKAIYFEQSKANILEQSFPAIDDLAAYLKKNKSFYVRIEGHTDNQGDEEALQKLSEARAEAIKEYLVYKRRIKPVRLETAGFGGSQPVTDNSTDELRAENRRVEVTIMVISKIIERPDPNASK